MSRGDDGSNARARAVARRALDGVEGLLRKFPEAGPFGEVGRLKAGVLTGGIPIGKNLVAFDHVAVLFSRSGNTLDFCGRKAHDIPDREFL
jgi:hypothetical protein